MVATSLLLELDLETLALKRTQQNLTWSILRRETQLDYLLADGIRFREDSPGTYSNIST